MPPKRPNDPVTVLQETARRRAEEADLQATHAAFRRGLITLIALHASFHTLFTAPDWMAYPRFVLGVGYMLIDAPWMVIPIALAIVMLWWGTHLWRHREDSVAWELPPFPPIPDLRFENSLYLGSGYTYDGKLPGDIIEADEGVTEPHIIVPEKGLFGNFHVVGGIGSGKTSAIVEPTIDQVLHKHPKPLPPKSFELGANGRYKALTYDPELDADPIRRERWNPYVGMSPSEADDEYKRLLAHHDHHKWAGLIYDPKGELAAHVLRCAKAAGREDDVYVLRPDAEWTLNPLHNQTNALVAAEGFVDGIEAVSSGKGNNPFYRSTGSEWLANAIALLQAVRPDRVNYETLLLMARKEEVRQQLTAEATRLMKEYQQREHEARRYGRAYEGPKVDPAVIDYFMSFDDPEADKAANAKILAGFKSHAKYFVQGEMANYLCPKLPPTFPGFRHMINEGKIVVLQQPLHKYGSVGRVLGILLLNEAQQVILGRMDPEDTMNKDRVIALIIDEVANYLNPETKRFISMNRGARCFCMFVHQSKGQIQQEGDRGFEVSFDDNLRTKITLSTAHAVAARGESARFGQRSITKERYSESTNIQGISREDGGDRIKGTGESKGASVSMEDTEEAWFKGETFMRMRTGQAVFSVFDGERTLDPRMGIAPQFFRTSRGERINDIEIDIPKREPHPFRILEGKMGDWGYLDTVLTNTGFVILDQIRSASGENSALRVISESGTVLVPIDTLSNDPDAYQTFSERLGDSEAIIVFGDSLETPKLLLEECGVTVERGLTLPGSLEATIPGLDQSLGQRLGRLPDSADTLADLLYIWSERTPITLEDGAWERFGKATAGNLRDLLEDSRILLSLYHHIGGYLADLGPDVADEFLASEMDRLYQEMKERSDEVRAKSPTDHPTPKSRRLGRTVVPVVDELSSSKSSRRNRQPSGPTKDVEQAIIFDEESLDSLLAPNPFDEADTKAEPEDDHLPHREDGLPEPGTDSHTGAQDAD